MANTSFIADPRVSKATAQEDYKTTKVENRLKNALIAKKANHFKSQRKVKYLDNDEYNSQASCHK